MRFTDLLENIFRIHKGDLSRLKILTIDLLCCFARKYIRMYLNMQTYTYTNA